MTESTAARPIPPLQRFVQIETDCFCDCGYNLHGQTVTRDERLNFMVCQCPECGRFHPAGHAVAAKSQWLGRLAAGTLIVWSLVVLVTLILLMIYSGAMQWTTVESMSYRGLFTSDGRLVGLRLQPTAGGHVRTYVDTGQPVPAGETSYYRRMLIPMDNGILLDQSALKERRFERNLAMAIVAFLGWLLGALATVFLWHWRKRNYVWVMLAVVVPAASVAIYMNKAYEYEFIRGWAISRVAMLAAMQCAFVMLGIWTGRPVGRFIAKVIIPPRPRQFLSFLWFADGKTPPSVKTATT